MDENEDMKLLNNNIQIVDSQYRNVTKLVALCQSICLFNQAKMSVPTIAVLLMRCKYVVEITILNPYHAAVRIQKNLDRGESI